MHSFVQVFTWKVYVAIVNRKELLNQIDVSYRTYDTLAVVLK